MAGVPVLSSVTGQRIAQTASRYIGYTYVYGGAPPPPGRWDCSSFASYVLGHDLGMAIPGGRWQAGTHGPVVVDYARWGGAATVPYPQAGDLCCWVGLGPNGHIGIAVSGTEMVSALNSSAGVTQTPIRGYGPAGAPLIYRRVTGLAAGGGTNLPVPVTQGPSSATPFVAVILAGLVAGAALVLALAAAGAAAVLLARVVRG